MNISRIDLNLLVVLDAIHAEGGVTRAGDKLNLTQPAISHALARLRALFGDPLFVRQGHEMIPTALTRRIIEPVRRALKSLETTLGDPDRFDPAAAKGRFAIGMRDVLEISVLPGLMRAIAAEAPDIDIVTSRLNRRSIEANLSSGQLDAVVDLPLTLPDTIRQRRISSDRQVVMARPNHPRLRDDWSLEHYLGADHILVSSRRKGPGFEDIALSRLGLRRRIKLRCQHAFAACQIVRDSDLLLTMSEGLALALNPAFGNDILPLPFDAPPMEFHLYWHEAADADPANRWLRAQFSQALGDSQRNSSEDRG